LKVLGIDPGTTSFDLCLLENKEVKYEESLPSVAVAQHPEEIAQKCLDLKPDVLVAPSGYGLPNRRLSQLSQRELFETTLVREGEQIPVLDGMKKLFTILKEAGTDALFLPGVIQLPTVPKWRKFNKIDMGTADKMCIGALSVELTASGKGGYSHVDHIVVELGGGYNCVMTIKEGRIINGIGGTLFSGPGYRNAGAMDGEVAYLLGGFHKGLLFEGGAGYLAGIENLDIVAFNAENHLNAFNSFVEGILFAVCSQRPLLASREVYLSGQMSRYSNIYDPIMSRLKELDYAVKPLPLLSHGSKAAAQGYAVVGNGLSSGVYQPLVKHMMIDKAEGSVLDNIYWKLS
jgi:predicted butyrate kinase (DUF1464 family)